MILLLPPSNSTVVDVIMYLRLLLVFWLSFTVIQSVPSSVPPSNLTLPWIRSRFPLVGVIFSSSTAPPPLGDGNSYGRIVGVDLERFHVARALYRDALDRAEEIVEYRDTVDAHVQPFAENRKVP